MKTSKKAKVKIDKADKALFDGKWFSNGYFMILGAVANLSDKSLQGVIDAGIPFSRTSDEVIKTGEDACVPDMSILINSAAKENDDVVTITDLTYRSSGEYDFRVCTRTDGVVCINDHYTSILSLGACYQSNDNWQKRNSSIAVYGIDGLVALVMPVRIGESRLEEEIVQVHDAFEAMNEEGKQPCDK